MRTSGVPAHAWEARRAGLTVSIITILPRNYRVVAIQLFLVTVT